MGGVVSPGAHYARRTAGAVARVRRESPAVGVRGRPASLRLLLAAPVRGGARLRQPVGPDLLVLPGEADTALDAELVGRRRGRHPLPAPAVRVRGPLGLGA